MNLIGTLSYCAINYFLRLVLLRFTPSLFHLTFLLFAGVVEMQMSTRPVQMLAYFFAVNTSWYLLSQFRTTRVLTFN